MFDASNVKKYFPKEAFREGQERAIKFACEAFESGKRIVILECPTGGGKSTIGMTLANMARSSYYLTVTKILQDQLMGDFPADLVELKGRNAYNCDLYERMGERLVSKQLMSQSMLEEKLAFSTDCNGGYCKTNQGRTDGHKCNYCFPEKPDVGVPAGILSVLPEGRQYSACPYYDQVFKAIKGKNVCMNFYSFLYQSMMTKRFDSPRELMIIDEAHATESVLLDIISFSLSSEMLKQYGVIMPEYETVPEYLHWFEKERIVQILGLALENAKKTENQREEEEIGRLIRKFKKFRESVMDIEWVVQIETTSYRDKVLKNAVFKPVFVRSFIESMLFKFSEKVLMMSATILNVNVFCRSLGLDPNEVAVYKMKNRFPLYNRPIYIKDCGPLTGGKSKMAEWMPKVIETVEEICNRHENERGIIHTHNFAILDALVDGCDRNVSRRFLTQRMIQDKKQLLEAHAKKRDSVIIAPAMHEGVDLKDDLSRFQILAKIPFPNIFDNKQLARKNDIDPEYTSWLTCLKLVQSYGRSVRGPEDHADTYIIDGSIHNFLRRNQKMLPQWFLEAINDHDRPPF